jgi:diacylglycerol O-acyltransferase
VNAAAGPASPLLAGRSARVQLGRLPLDLDLMRAAARRLDVKVNDIFLAGLLDGLGRYHAKHGRVAPSVRLGVPISLRSSELEMQNQLFAAVLRGPLGRLDFEERARLVHEMIALARNQPWMPVFEDLAAAVVRMPGAAQLVNRVAGALDVLASNVTGPDFPMWLAGLPITAMTPVGPRGGAALNVTLLSYRSQVELGLNIDPAAVNDPDVLLDCLIGAFDEALGG